MTSLARMLAVLELFDETTPVLTADAIAARLGYSRPTAYRYVRELTAFGLLARAPLGYALGPRIIELDWLIRRGDPVLALSRPIARDLAAKSGCNVTQMWMSGDRIVTLDQVAGPEPVSINFDRGRPLPLFRGAPSLAILAFQPRARIVKLWDAHRAAVPPAVAAAGLAAFLARLQSIRRAGHVVSLGELDTDKVGIGAPVRAEGRVAGSLCLVMTSAQYEAASPEHLVPLLTQAAEAISCALESASDPHTPVEDHQAVTPSQPPPPRARQRIS